MTLAVAAGTDRAPRNGAATAATPVPEPSRTLPGVRLWTCDLDAGGAGGLAADREILSRDERARADRFRFTRDRDRFIRGRAFLRRTLGAALARPAADLDLVEGPWGKPELACGTLDFNLSHSGPLAVLAVSQSGPVGLDVELIDRKVDTVRLAESCFSPSERAILDALGAADRHRRFFAFWTAKEALMKLTGQGMSLPPLGIALRLQDDWPVGCTRPETLNAVLSFVDPGRADAICCLARFPDDPFPGGTP